MASMESSRLQSLPQVVQPVQIESRWIGLLPVAFEVFQVAAPLYVVAKDNCDSPSSTSVS